MNLARRIEKIESALPITGAELLAHCKTLSVADAIVWMRGLTDDEFLRFDAAAEAENPERSALLNSLPDEVFDLPNDEFERLVSERLQAA